MRKTQMTAFEKKIFKNKDIDPKWNEQNIDDKILNQIVDSFYIFIPVNFLI